MITLSKARGKLKTDWAAPAPDAPKAMKARGSGDLVGLNFKLTNEQWTRLGVLAAQLRRSKQDLMSEGLEHVLRKYGG